MVKSLLSKILKGFLLKNNRYSKEIKLKVVKMRIEEYPLSHIKIQFNLKSHFQIISWTKKYLELYDPDFNIDNRRKVSDFGKDRPKKTFLLLKRKLNILEWRISFLKITSLADKKTNPNKYEIIFEMNKTYSISSFCKTVRLSKS